MRIPAFLLTAFFVKNETVNGIIGNTHGVSNATSPPRKPSANKVINPFDFVSPEEDEDDATLQSDSGRSRLMVGIKILLLVLAATPPSRFTTIIFSSGIKFSLSATS